MRWFNNRSCLFIGILICASILILSGCGKDNKGVEPSKVIEPVKVITPSKGVEGFTNKLMKRPVDKFSNKYDEHYITYSRKNFGRAFDWRWFKAQGQAESCQNPLAVSPVGAKGIMQIMPETMKEIVRKNSYILNDVFNPKYSIAAGIYYDSYLYKQWRSKRPELDRIALMTSAYNCGLGNVLKAQKVCISSNYGGCNTWNSIKSQGAKVSSWKYQETLGYVNRIFRYMGYSGY